jgi:hypothetical protein
MRMALALRAKATCHRVLTVTTTAARLPPLLARSARHGAVHVFMPPRLRRVQARALLPWLPAATRWLTSCLAVPDALRL